MTVISKGPYACGETPLWDKEAAALYWVDADAHRIYRWRESSSEIECFDPKLPLTAIRKGKTGIFLLLCKYGLYEWTPEGNKGRGDVLAGCDCLDSKGSLRFNDGIPLPSGDFAAGAFDESDLYNGQGKLYIINIEGKCEELDHGLHVPNGVALSPDGETLYLSEMYKYRVLAYNLKEKPGDGQTNRKIHLEIPESKGKPDGLLCDAAGNLWVAHWRGARISKFSLGGDIMEELETECASPTCPCFGSDENEIYFTSATLELSEEEIAGSAVQGGVFRISRN